MPSPRGRPGKARASRHPAQVWRLLSPRRRQEGCPAAQAEAHLCGAGQAGCKVKAEPSSGGFRPGHLSQAVIHSRDSCTPLFRSRGGHPHPSPPAPFRRGGQGHGQGQSSVQVSSEHTDTLNSGTDSGVGEPREGDGSWGRMKEDVARKAGRGHTSNAGQGSGRAPFPEPENQRPAVLQPDRRSRAPWGLAPPGPGGWRGRAVCRWLRGLSARAGSRWQRTVFGEGQPHPRPQVRRKRGTGAPHLQHLPTAAPPPLSLIGRAAAPTG